MASRHWILRLVEDRLGPGADRRFPPAPRVVYVVADALRVDGGPAPAALAAGQTWHGAAAVSVAAGPGGARAWRWELLPEGRPAPVVEDAPGWRSRELLRHELALDPARPYLLRCDRVEFEPGAVAPPHRHQGGGIRCLAEGALDVQVGDAPARRMHPGDAWFESGREPVLAIAAPEGTTAFLRVAVLPGELRGRPSIVYVDPADATRGRPRRYTVHVDAPLTLDGALA